MNVTEECNFSRSPIQIGISLPELILWGVKSDFPYWNQHDMVISVRGAATDEAEITRGVVLVSKLRGTLEE